MHTIDFHFRVYNERTVQIIIEQPMIRINSIDATFSTKNEVEIVSTPISTKEALEFADYLADVAYELKRMVWEDV